MKKYFFIVFMLFGYSVYAKDLKINQTRVEESQKKLKSRVESFYKSLSDTALDKCISELLKGIENEYDKCLIGNVLFPIDKSLSFRLHKEAFLKDKSDYNFALEYAVELHRAGEYREAIKLYEECLKVDNENNSYNIWLSDCYINIGELSKSIKYFNKSFANGQETTVDFAIHSIYQDTNQFKRRDKLRKDLINHSLTAAYSLIYYDCNWVIDWWNSSINDDFLNSDLNLINQLFSSNERDLNTINAFVKIKRIAKLSRGFTFNKSTPEADSIISIFTTNRLIINGLDLTENGNMLSDLINICLANNIINENEYYYSRGKDIFSKAIENKDPELLNVYAYLQAGATKKVEKEVDSIGWMEFKDVRFANSFITGMIDSLKSDNEYLEHAMKDFPNSTSLLRIKCGLLLNEKKDVKPTLTLLIINEFKKLGYEYSHPLRFYFAELEKIN